MTALVPYSLPGDEIQRCLVEGERVVSSFGPYHATSRRVLLAIPPKADSDLQLGHEKPLTYELPYVNLASITEVKAIDRRKIALGACLTVIGIATLFAWYLIAPIVSVVAGVFIMLQGATEKPAYYQLRGRDMEGEELYKWQIIHYGSGSFIASISTMTGVEAIRD